MRWCARPATWQGVEVAETAHSTTDAPTSGLTLPDVAERLGVLVTKVHQLLNDGSLASVRIDGVRRIPAGFVRGDEVVKGLPGVLTLLRDGGYDDEQAIRWLHTPDDSLPGTPVDALQADRSREVKRRAQALAL